MVLSPNTEFDKKGAIRDGIPVIFLQFCPEGPLVRRVFAVGFIEIWKRLKMALRLTANLSFKRQHSHAPDIGLRLLG